LSDVENVFLGRKRENKDVVEVDETIQHVPEHIVYRGLENSGSVGEPKRHDQVLIMSTGRIEGHLPLVSLADPNKVVVVRTM
jgi:hypothetical protein